MTGAATSMDLEIIKLSDVSQRKTNIIRYHLYMESKNKPKKKDVNELIYKIQTDFENKLTELPKRKGGEGEGWIGGLGLVMGTLFYMEWMVNGDLLCSKGELYPTFPDKEAEKEWICAWARKKKRKSGRQ